MKTEQFVTLPIMNPETGGLSRTFQYAGMIDAIKDGKLYEYKSTSDVNFYIQQRSLSWQPYLYAAAAEALGHGLHEIEYRLISVPGIKVCGKDATIQDYQNRCLEWLDQPGKVVTHPLMINPARLERVKELLWDTSKRILDCRHRNIWLTNEGACKMFNRTCEYLPLCLAAVDGHPVDDLISTDYDRQTKDHPELPEQFSNGKELLTYSNISTLTSCEQKFFWRHESGLRKKREQPESMWLGSAMHQGLARLPEGLDQALMAIQEWVDANPAIGAMAKQQDQQVAKARAMVTAADLKWEISK